ncbi:PAS domain-containing sensor histidine kinase [Salegentibacter maritimus]|uniref:PAS domain-containing sensor histidine kinase n=1 Tax=Salegentibacter maritimus TaxID=2794347 RepID=UPI0018E46776|nr:PAS domain S-box protein [Salegentibacter maritimus]MBI6118052.1 PAS domain S-box protein [Salegentibacter maritimus]
MQLDQKIQILERALQREKAARKAAENILEEKSTELYNLSEELRRSKNSLEDLLNRKTSELEGVFENIIDAYVVMELSGDVIKMNQAAIDLLGYNVSLEPINLVKLVKREYLDYTFETFKELITHGKFNNYKAVIITKNGEEKTVQINASVIYDSNENPIAAQGIARDITEDMRLRKLMEEQKQQLDIIFKNSPIGVSLSKSLESGLIMVNQAMCDMLGYTKEEFMNVQVQDLTHPDDIEESKILRQKMFKGEIDRFNIEKRYITKNKEIVWAKTSVTGVKDSKGITDLMVATVEDITEQKEANTKLKESENRMATLIMNLETGILLEDETRHISLTNQKFCDMFNIPVPPEVLIGTDCSNAAEESKHHFQKPEQFVEGITQLLENKQTVLAEELHLKDGRILERSYIPIYSEGVYKGHLWSYDDVTIPKRYKESLRAQKEKYSNIIANMNLGLIEVDNNDKILMANHSFCDISGYSEEELKGKVASQLLLHEEQENIVLSKNSDRGKGLSDSYELKVRMKSGEIRNWLVSGAPNYDVNGNVIGSIGIHLDITDRKKLEEKQVELLKSLESQNEKLNDYAHVVSHDLKSPLRNISALLSWTREDFAHKLGPESVTNIDLMQNKVEKMDHLIESILKYSSIGSTTTIAENVDAHEVVEEILSMIFIPKNIKVVIKNKLPVIKADATGIQQLFQNLISNAVNYIDKTEGLVEIDVEEKNKEYIFSIKDNGCGIPKEYHEKIFKIFSSASTHQKSTGIGLSIVRKIIDLNNGKIWLESETGIGTTFYFSLNKTA